MSDDPRAQAIRERIRQLAGRDDLTARLLFAALVDHLLGDAGRCIVVGGTAVDAYVGGAFGSSEAYPAGWRESLDVDTIALVPASEGGRGRLRRDLEAAGFEASSTGGSFSLAEIPYALDVVSRELPADYNDDHLVDVRLSVDLGPPGTARAEDGEPRVRLVGPEDLLFDYLESAVVTHHQRDWARALAIAEVLGGDLDLGYLYGKAHQRRAGEFVDDLDRLLAGEPLPDPG
jgi:hypothetical protein